MATTSMNFDPTLLLLLFVFSGETLLSHGFTVDPPENIVIVDPGHLGHLEITWSPPKNQIHMEECSVMYQLDYYDAYKKKWSAVRTSQRKYSAQFDLLKDVEVRVYTLLDGLCTNFTLRKSSSYTGLIQKAPDIGIVGTEIQDFTCVFQNMEHVECKWKESRNVLANSQRNLFFWYKSLERAEECSTYILSSGVRSGCNFTANSLPDFTDVTFCVNGSSPEGPLKPLFTSLQIQNKVKPAAADVLTLQADEGNLVLDWNNPAGFGPGQCLEWQVEHSQEDQEGKELKELTFAEEANLTFPWTPLIERSCFRVRSRMNSFCVDEGFWSDWSPPVCHPEFINVEPEQHEYTIPVYIFAAAALIMLMLSLGVWALIKLRKSKQEKKLYSLLSGMFTRSSAMPKAFNSGGVHRV